MRIAPDGRHSLQTELAENKAELAEKITELQANKAELTRKEAENAMLTKKLAMMMDRLTEARDSILMRAFHPPIRSYISSIPISLQLPAFSRT